MFYSVLLPSYDVFLHVYMFLAPSVVPSKCLPLDEEFCWPAREVVRQNMPTTLNFKQLYPKCVVIIDCLEIFIETPSKFEARSKTYSNYKKHNTIKFLIGITPCGSISYLSQCWGGPSIRQKFDTGV